MEIFNKINAESCPFVLGKNQNGGKSVKKTAHSCPKKKRNGSKTVGYAPK
jgi:hypothetical protein